MSKRSQTLLPNGCRCSKMIVNPKNWKSRNAPVDKPWFIHYRFYAPGFKPVQVQLRGMNSVQTVKGRQKMTEDLIEMEMRNLQHHGYNPISRREAKPFEFDITIDTLLMPALRFALTKLKAQPSTKEYIASQLNTLENFAPTVSLHSLNKGHIKNMLEAAQEKKHLSAATFNTYRGRLMMLFSVIEELGVIEDKQLFSIKKQTEIKKIKETISDDQRERVAERLQRTHPAFWRYLNIFFHSGCRSSELLRLKTEHVNLKKQEFVVTILKGKNPREVKKTIKDIASGYWEDALKGATKGQYIFGPGFLPGDIQQYKKGPTQVWKRNVKKALGFTSDFYALKHLHSTEVSDLISQQAAAAHNSHSGTAMVRNIYDVNSEERERNKLKSLNNKFI